MVIRCGSGWLAESERFPALVKVLANVTLINRSSDINIEAPRGCCQKKVSTKSTADAIKAGVSDADRDHEMYCDKLTRDTSGGSHRLLDRVITGRGLP